MIPWQLVETVSVLNSVLFLNGKNTYFVYPVILVFGCVLSLTIPPELFRNLKTLYLFNDNNVWNRLFANQGDLLFVVTYFMMMINKLLEFSLVNKYHQVPDDMEGQIEEESKTRKIMKSMRGYVLRLLTIQGSIFGLLAIRGFVLRLTSIDESKLTGFRISGHFIFLTAVGISTVLEFGHSLSDSLLFENLKMEQSSFKLSAIFYFYTFTMFVSILSVLVWMICLLVTAVFYHTFLEKVLGLGFGMVPPSLTYLILTQKFEFMK